MTTSPLLRIAVLWIAGLGASMQFAKITVSFPTLQQIYPGSDATLGLLLSSISVLGVLLGLVAGQMVASFGFRRMLVWALVGGGILSGFQSLLPDLGWFMASRVIEGVSHLSIVVAAPTLMALLTPEKWRFLSMTLWSAFFGVGYALTTAFGPWLIDTFGAGAVFATHAIYMLLMSVLVALFLPKGATERPPFPGFVALMKRHVAAYSSPREFAPGAGWLFYTCTFVSLMTVLPLLLEGFDRDVLIPMLPIASILSSFTISALLLRSYAAVTVVQIGLAASLVISAAALILPLNGWLFVALFVALGLVQSGSFAAVPQLNTEPASQALSNGAMAQMGNLGNLVGTPLMFALLTSLGTTSVYLMLMVCFGGAIAAHGWLAHLRRRQAS